MGNGPGLLIAEEQPWMNNPYSLTLTLPPLGAIVLKPEGPLEEVQTAEAVAENQEDLNSALTSLLQERFSAGKVQVEVRGQEAEGRLVLEFRIESKHDCLLHWGLSRRRDPQWQAPPESTWPPATTPFDRHAVQSACQAGGGHGCVIRIALDLPCPWDSLAFVLYSPRDDRWLRNGDRGLPGQASPPGQRPLTPAGTGGSDRIRGLAAPALRAE